MRKIYIISFLLFIASCNKERNIHVKAINPVTNEPYSDLRVVITSSKTGFDGEVVKTVYDGNLNSDGEAIIKLKIKKNRSYAIRCEQPSNVCYTKKLQYYYTVHDDNNPSFLFEYAPCSYRTLNIQNVNCEGPDDIFNMDMRLLYNEDYTAFYFTEKYGCYSNEFGSEQVPAGKWVIEWWVTRSGNTNHFTDTIELIENELFYYEINY